MTHGTTFCQIEGIRTEQEMICEKHEQVGAGVCLPAS